jgi:hypothetical protein
MKEWVSVAPAFSRFSREIIRSGTYFPLSSRDCNYNNHGGMMWYNISDVSG